jgi:hypothetical protein
VLSALAASMSSFAGELSFQLSCVEPLIERDVAATLCARVESLLCGQALSAQASLVSPRLGDASALDGAVV